jgi:hypothetical protein
MADNVTIDPGDTPSIAISTDDAGAGGHVQRVKLALSADGSAAHATVDADGVLVNLGANNDVTVSGVSTAANQTTIIGHVDGIETLIGTTNSTLTTIDGRVDGVETLIGTTNSTLTTIDGRVDTLESLIGTTNSTLTTIDGRVDGVETLLGRLLPRATTVVDVSLASDTTSAQLLAANANRIGLTLTNTDANGVYVYFGTTAVATKFTVLIPAGGYYEMPQPIYTGRLDALWAGNGSGSLIGTELAA